MYMGVALGYIIIPLRGIKYPISNKECPVPSTSSVELLEKEK
jgi:hypothetical protein